MKKILFIGICCLCLCGCGSSWKNDFQVSDIKIKTTNFSDGDNMTDISYSIKNNSNYTCKGLKAIIQFKSGSITVEETIYPSTLSPLTPNGILEDKQTFFHKDYEGYTATFKNIECYEKD